MENSTEKRVKIDGLKYHFTSEELAEHMRKRAAYHEGRAEEKSRALPEIKAAIEKVKRHAATEGDVSQITKMSSPRSSYQFGQPDRDLEADIKDHQNRALVFRALADHVVAHALYELSENDLRRLEIVKDA